MNNFFSQVACRSKSCSVLVDIVIHVEMRNTFPLKLNFVVIFSFEVIVFLIEVCVKLIHEVRCQDLTRCICLMDSMLKLSKLCLTEDSSLETIQIVVKNSKTCLVIFNLFKKRFCQDIFIGCRCNFRQEDWVISVNIWLSLTCES